MFEGYDDLMSIPDVMEALHIGKNRVYEMLNNGEIKAFRMGKPWKIPKESVIQYVLSQAGLMK